MKVKTGKQQVVFYEGTIPSGGKQVFEFGSRKFVHRSIKKDKSDYLLDQETKIILMAYPLGSNRSIVLNHLAENLHKLEHYIRNPESYEIVDKGVLLQKKSKAAEEEVSYDMEREPSYSRSGKFNHLNKDVVVKKKYNIKEAKW